MRLKKELIFVDTLEELIVRYDLAPNDAMIAATCEHYGIYQIATYDEDFTRVDFLKVIRP